MTYQNSFKVLIAAGVLFACNSVSAQITPLKTTPTHVAPVDKSTATNGHYTPWKPIAEKDIVKKVRVFEEIDIAKNKELFAVKNNGNDLMDVFIAGEASGKLSVEGASDGGMPTKKLSHEEFLAQCAKVKSTPVTKYILKEDSLWLNTGEVVLRILSIAPVVSVKPAIGSAVERELFWAFYFDAREHFLSHAASPSLSWDEVFVGRHFTGTIVKRTVSEFQRAASSQKKKANMPVK
jgi:hypothetical protein